MIEGKCLCGEITYKLKGELLYLYHCHCNECKRFSGSSFATNASVMLDELVVHDPKDRLVKFESIRI